MERLEKFGLSLPIQPLYMQLLLYVLAMAIFFRFANEQFLGNLISASIIVPESLCCGALAVAATTFSTRKSYGILGKRHTPHHLKYWVEFQKSVIYRLIPEDTKVLNSFPGLIEESFKQRVRVSVYVPVIFALGTLINMILFFTIGQGYWIFFATTFLLVGLSCLYDSMRRLSKINKLNKILSANR